MGIDKVFARLYSMHFFYVFSHVFGWTLSSLYFAKIGYSFLDIALYFALSFITGVLMVMALKKSLSSRLMRIGLVLKVIIFVLAAYVHIKPLLFVAGLLHGLMTISYWVPMNIHFFKFRQEGKNASHTGLFFLMWPLLGAILPAFAGIAAQNYGMPFVFFLSAAILIPGLLFSYTIKQSDALIFSFKNFTGNTKGLKTILFLQGIWEGIDWVVVPLATLAFVSTEAGFGAFYSYLGFFGIIAFFLVGRVSDRMKKRAVFLYPVTIAMAAFTVLSGLSSTFFEWGVYRGAVSFLVNLFSPFAMTIVIDMTKNIQDSMISREFFLNFGRALGAMIVALMLVMAVPIQYALVVSGAILLLHPLFLRAKKKGYHVEI